MTPFISNLFHLPVRRVEILKRAKRYKESGLCYAILKAAGDYKVNVHIPLTISFPLFTYNNAFPFGAKIPCGYCMAMNQYWWPRGIWDSGREDFLNWLIEQYKNDKTNLRKL